MKTNLSTFVGYSKSRAEREIYTNHLSFHLRKLAKLEHIISKINRMKEILRIITVIIKIKNA